MKFDEFLEMMLYRKTMVNELMNLSYSFLVDLNDRFWSLSSEDS